ncbi:MAG: c-type cytochrome [Gemmatimonadaceae bacterium]
MRPSLPGALSTLIVALFLVSCDRDSSRTRSKELPDVATLQRIPMGPVPGLAVSTIKREIPNPYSANVGATADGQRLYVRMNCVYCHGWDGGGGMGPNLRDSVWRFGGTDADIFNSIYEGRPKGMPAWGALLPPDEIWKLAAYVRTLSSGGPPEFSPMKNMTQNDPDEHH